VFQLFGWVFIIIAFSMTIFFVILPTIAVWSALFNGSYLAGILFSVFLFPVAILGYPLVMFFAGISIGFGIGPSFMATIIGYVLMAVTYGCWLLSGWFGNKAEEQRY
jgi:ABC-type spermidine/putrescine transport system permease subunit II